MLGMPIIGMIGSTTVDAMKLPDLMLGSEIQ